MSGVIQLNPFTLWLSEWMTESCEVLSGLITQNMELLGKYFHIVADLRMGRGDSPPFPVKFCQYSILSKITISYLYSWQVSRCDTPTTPSSLSEFSWSPPAHNDFCFSAFYKIIVKCGILLNFYFGHTLGARGFLFSSNRKHSLFYPRYFECWPLEPGYFGHFLGRKS